jgi:hypothetical protein
MQLPVHRDTTVHTLACKSNAEVGRTAPLEVYLLPFVMVGSYAMGVAGKRSVKLPSSARQGLLMQPNVLEPHGLTVVHRRVLAAQVYQNNF